jgi:hypothetical protein
LLTLDPGIIPEILVETVNSVLEILLVLSAAAKRRIAKYAKKQRSRILRNHATTSSEHQGE